jgi:glucokinase
MSVVAAVDVGGSGFRGALVDRQGHILHTESVARDGQSGEAALAMLLAQIDRLRAGADIVALGVIAPALDERTGSIPFAVNLGWRDLPLRSVLAAHTGLPVGVGHDVRSAGRAELALGAARGHADAAMVMLGTGIAATLVSNGAVLGGQSGELGHIPVHPGGTPCACGQRGCLEAYASAGAVARRYRQAGGEALSAATIAARLGRDARADAVWAEAVEALALGLVTLTLLLDPAVIVLGGGLAEAGAALTEPLEAAMARHMTLRPAPPLRRSRLGQTGALLGAAMLGFAAAGETEVASGWAFC